jgi:class 3 adenylate cyclase
MPPSTPKRMLAAVMFTDMVGYTHLMEQDEKQAIKLRNRHRESLSHWHDIYDGKIIQYFGDGTLSVFQSAGNAVKCAIATQIDLQKTPEVPLRIGIHSGEIVYNHEDIIGSTVNIASRIESFANIGGVLVSETVRHELRNQTDLDFQPLGRYQLKNVEHPMEIFAVSNPGIKVPHPSDLQGKGMPLKMKMPETHSRLSKFIGREKDITVLGNLIKKSRLLTIIGPGGIGKTRLSLQILSSVASYFKDGTIFVPLTSVHDPAYVIPTIANTLGLKKESGNGLFEILVSFLNNKQILLILDNFEQIISARDQISRLMRFCENLKLLITSREALNIEGEQLYPLRPFSLPEENQSRPVDEWLNYESIQLFFQRAKAAKPSFQLNHDNAPFVAEICMRLDGLPLAIELAASHIRLLSPRAILKRLENRFSLLTSKNTDLPKRHQTIWNTILWSYEMLDREEQKLLRFISIFVGGCDLSALEEHWIEIGSTEQFVLG